MFGERWVGGFGDGGDGGSSHENVAPGPTVHRKFTQVTNIGTNVRILIGDESVTANTFVDLITVEGDEIGAMGVNVFDEGLVGESGGIIAR